MSRNIYLAKRLREVLLSGKWIANTNFKEQIQDIHWHRAIQQLGDLNSIALLTFHINYYLKGLIEVFEGGNLTIRDKFSFDMEDVKSQEDWHALVNNFLENAESFASHIEKMSDDIFDEPFVDAKYGNYLRNIEGMIEHCYYHLGQVVIINKMTKGNTAS
ncbi:MAG: hypothetical protein RLZZ546_25 [Bacteroidota bacterium]|jgi:hypothetical protein